MTQKHPITPPEELVDQWNEAWIDAKVKHEGLVTFIATQAARWGADQELEACLQWFSAFYCMETWMQKDLEKFRAARRLKPPSLKEQAFTALRTIETNIPQSLQAFEDSCEHIRRALECLSD